MATYYVDGTRSDDTGNGLSEANAKKTLGAGLALMTAAGDILYVKNSATYTLTASAGYPASGGSLTARSLIEGYTTTPGDGGRPLITSATDGVHLFNNGDGTERSYLTWRNLRISHTASTRGNGWRASFGSTNYPRLENVSIDGCAVGFEDNYQAIGLVVSKCEIKNCTSHGLYSAYGVRVFGSEIRNNGGDGVRMAWQDTTWPYEFESSIIAGNSGYGINFSLTGNGTQGGPHVRRCVIWGNTSDGVRTAETTDQARTTFVNNVIGLNGGYGINLGPSTAKNDNWCALNWGNAYYSNTSGPRNNLAAGTGDVTLSADPFTDSSGGDFSLNSTAGGGAACRAAGFPGAFPAGLVTGYADIGAVQHQDSGGGGGGVRRVSMDGLCG